MPTIKIRWARPEDAAQMIRLWKLLAVYERHPPEVVSISEAQVRRDGFGPDRRFECLLVERDGAVVGLAAFIQDYATWTGQSGMFVHDLILEESARGGGVGRKLMAALASIAKARGWQRLDLNVRPWNPARRFYGRLPMKHRDDLMIYAMDANTIHDLAADAPALS